MLGEVDLEDLDAIPFALRRLASPSEYRNFDNSGMGLGVEGVEENEDAGGGGVGLDEANGLESVLEADDPSVQTNGARDINKMSLMAFREKLVVHFNIKFSRHELQWPERQRIITHRSSVM